MYVCLSAFPIVLYGNLGELKIVDVIMLLLWILDNLMSRLQVFVCYVIDVVVNYKINVYGTLDKI